MAFHDFEMTHNCFYRIKNELFCRYDYFVYVVKG